MPAIKFLKAQALGNDFVMLNTVEYDEYRALDFQSLARDVSHRRHGVGCDQLLVFCESQQADIRMRIFNQDGSEAENCGNGLLSAALWLSQSRSASEFSIEVKAGVKHVGVSSAGQSWVNMGIVAVDTGCEVSSSFGAQTIYPVSVGNPHGVIQVGDIAVVPIAQWGPELQQLNIFPDHANIQFVEVAADGLKARAWERGSGETQACGSGAVAVAGVAITQQWLQTPVVLEYPGGQYRVEVNDKQEFILHGQAHLVFKGVYQCV